MAFFIVPKVFPTCVGVILNPAPTPADNTGVPHICGGDS